MNEQIKQLAGKALDQAVPETWTTLTAEQLQKVQEKFAELIVRECTGLLFDESERLYAYSSECDSMRDGDEAEVVAEKCIDLMTMIEQHFGVE